MEEPSVLDYVKSKLMPWRGVRIDIPAPLENQPPEDAGQVLVPEESISEPVDAGCGEEPVQILDAARKTAPVRWPWRIMAALALALLAQRMLQPTDRNPLLGVFFYFLAAVLCIWAILIKEWELSPLEDDDRESMPLTLNLKAFLLMGAAAILAFIAFGGNTFTATNIFLWALAIVYLFWALWLRHPRGDRPGIWKSLRVFFKDPVINLRITPWGVMMAAAIALVLYFRLHNLAGIPGEMISDHAEKLLDVNDVLNGKTSIFFIRNTGREFFQMYLTAAVALFQPGGLSFLSLKIGTALAGLVTLPFIYLLGKEIGGRWVGFLAFLLAGVAYWPNVIARIGLRFPLYPLFTAPMLYFLVRGLRRQNRNDFIWAGVALGLGLHGYSPMRIVPIVAVLLVGLYLLHRQARGKAPGVLFALVILAVTALVLFLPLGRYAVDEPQMFGVRAFSRLGTIERDYPAPVLEIFFSNLIRAWIMPWWDNGEIWVHSLPHRPALDLVTAALYALGTIWLMVRYVRHRHWLDLFMLVLVPLLMMPSILSLAFPAENPSLNRASAAYIPIFIIAALAAKTIVTSLVSRWKSIPARTIIITLSVIIIGLAASENYDLVFRQYSSLYTRSAWNTTQIASVLRQFETSTGTSESSYVVGYPHWVDTRVVGILAGHIEQDYAIWPDGLGETLKQNMPKMFILKPEDSTGLSKLRSLYPFGQVRIYPSGLEGKDFVIFTVYGSNP